MIKAGQENRSSGQKKKMGLPSLCSLKSKMARPVELPQSPLTQPAARAGMAGLHCIPSRGHRVRQRDDGTWELGRGLSSWMQEGKGCISSTHWKYGHCLLCAYCVSGAVISSSRSLGPLVLTPPGQMYYLLSFHMVHEETKA